MSAAKPVLTLRELNRATLARQVLLQRENVPVLEAVQRLVALQSQVTNPPYVGLWTRLKDFGREDLTRLMLERRVVLATLMRATLQLMTADDYLLLRPALQPALTRSIARKRLDGLDLDRLVEVAREFFEDEPRTFADLRPVLSELEPERDQSALAYAVRTQLPLVQVPSGGVWGYSGNAPFTTPERWLGRSPIGLENARPRTQIPRRLRPGHGEGRPDVVGQDATEALGRGDEVRAPHLPRREGKRTARPPRRAAAAGRLPGPLRFVPDYDNLVLSHAGRRRVIADEHRKKIFLSAARVRATFLIDGFVRGAWKVEKKGKAAALQIEPFGPLSGGDRNLLGEEGERLVCFVAEPQDATTFEVRFQS